MKTALLALVLLALLSGCGEASNSAGPTPVPADVSDQDIADAFGGTLNGVGRFSFQTSGGIGCATRMVIHGAAEVQDYLQAGDSVVTNPSKTIGVEVVPMVNGGEQACTQHAAEVMGNL